MWAARYRPGKVIGPGLMSDNLGTAMHLNAEAILALVHPKLNALGRTVSAYDIGGTGQVTPLMLMPGGSGTIVNVNRRPLGSGVTSITPEEFKRATYDGAADLVIMSGLVEYFDAPSLDTELRRVFCALRPGGTLIVAEGHYPTFFGRNLASLAASVSQCERIAYWSHPDLAGRLADAGFLVGLTHWSRGIAMQSYVISAEKPLITDGEAA